MTETLYHVETGLPRGFRVPDRRVEISYGSHAREEALSDRYGQIRLPHSLSLRRMRVIEVGVDNDKVTKILFRGRLDDERDLCIVLVPVANGPWRCKTVWVNLNSDQHKALDRSRYVAA
jgi:hypothetical protein